MKKNNNEKKKNIIIYVCAILAILFGIFIFFEFIWPFFNRNCFGCYDTRCSRTIRCNCPENSKKCDCVYLDKNQKEDNIVCPNNNLITTNGTR